MRELIDSARLVLLPYRDATQSGVGLQAIARGVPCIVSEVGGLPDLVPPGRDWVVPARDPASLAASILEALDHDEDERRELLAFACEHFAWPAVAAQLLGELRRLGILTR